MSKLLAAITVAVCACCTLQDARAQTTSLFESSEPPMLTEAGCMVASEMLLVARALAAESVERSIADNVMLQVFGAWSDHGSYNDQLRSQLTDVAYRSIKRPVTLSMAFLSHCQTLRGQRRSG